MVIARRNRASRFTRVPNGRFPRTALLLQALVVVAVAVGVFASSAWPRVAGKIIPSPLKGSITYCTEGNYAPLEVLSHGKAVGSDVDIGDQVAKALGLSAKWNVMDFDAVVPALNASKCDAIIAGISVTPQRLKQLDFASYAKAPQSLLLLKGNPKHINSMTDLSGKAVSVLAGTNDLTGLQQLNKILKKEGKSPCKISIYQSEADGIFALKTGKVDAWASGYGNNSWYAFKTGSGFALGPIFGPQLIPATTYGIATLKSAKPLHVALVKAVRQLYAKGIAPRILSHWHLNAFILTTQQRAQLLKP